MSRRVQCPHVAEMVLPPAYKDIAFKSLFTDCSENPKECTSPFHKYMCTTCFEIVCSKCNDHSRVKHFRETGHPVSVKCKLDFYCCGCGDEPAPIDGESNFKELFERLYVVKHGEMPQDTAQAMNANESQTPDALLSDIRGTVSQFDFLKEKFDLMGMEVIRIANELDFDDPKWEAELHDDQDTLEGAASEQAALCAPVPDCPNRSNPHHSCTAYCHNKWGDGMDEASNSWSEADMEAEMAAEMAAMEADGIQHNTASAHQDDSSDESDEADNIVGVAPSFEIADTDDGVVVTVDLPGIESVVGVDLEVCDSVLTLEAERYVMDQNKYVLELPLPPVDEDSIRARFDNATSQLVINLEHKT